MTDSKEELLARDRESQSPCQPNRLLLGCYAALDELRSSGRRAFGGSAVLPCISRWIAYHGSCQRIIDPHPTVELPRSALTTLNFDSLIQ